MLPAQAKEYLLESQTTPLSFLRRRSRIHAILALSILLLPVLILSVSIGSEHIPFMTTVKIILSKLHLASYTPTWQPNVETAVFDLRLPRSILAATAGTALSTAGATYQGLFRNPLADPYLLGIAQGAGLGAVFGFILNFGWTGWGMGVVPALAFTGGLAAVFLVCFFGRVGRTLPMTTLILAGVALGAFLSAIQSYLILTQENLHGIWSWILGGFASPKWAHVHVALPIVLLGSLFICLYGRRLNVMQLDEEQAQQLGINVERTKRTLLLVATLVTAAAVSVGGLIGFVGIIVPHAVRLIWGPDYRFLLPLSAAAGAIFLVLAELLSRTAHKPEQIPLGIITAFIGGPFFLFILRQRKRAVF